jgi:hypothetical protein
MRSDESLNRRGICSPKIHDPGLSDLSFLYEGTSEVQVDYVQRFGRGVVLQDMSG